jgi:hypothetical protein
MKKILCVLMVPCFLSSCGFAYVKSELTGTAKPAGGISEAVPVRKNYDSVSFAQLWKACQDVLDDQGYTYSSDNTSGRIKTDPRILGDTSKFVMTAAYYSAVVSIKVEGSSVTYKARFNKRSNITMAEDNAEYPEKENAMRKDFFSALDSRIASIAVSGQPSQKVEEKTARPASKRKTSR